MGNRASLVRIHFGRPIYFLVSVAHGLNMKECSLIAAGQMLESQAIARAAECILYQKPLATILYMLKW